MFAGCLLFQYIPELFIIVGVFVVDVTIDNTGNFQLGFSIAQVLDVQTLTNQFLLGYADKTFKRKVQLGTANFGRKFTSKDPLLQVKVQFEVSWFLLSQIQLFAINLDRQLQEVGTVDHLAKVLWIADLPPADPCLVWEPNATVVDTFHLVARVAFFKETTHPEVFVGQTGH